jgi:hypothetical protein
MALRDLQDEAGGSWIVFPVRPSVSGRATGGTRAELTEGWLCFQCGDERRRSPGIPDDWESLSDSALLLLLGKSQKARPTRQIRGRS